MHTVTLIAAILAIAAMTNATANPNFIRISVSSGQVKVWLDKPPVTDAVIKLTSTNPRVIIDPATITIAAGAATSRHKSRIAKVCSDSATTLWGIQARTYFDGINPASHPPVRGALPLTECKGKSY